MFSTPQVKQHWPNWHTRNKLISIQIMENWLLLYLWIKLEELYPTEKGDGRIEKKRKVVSNASQFKQHVQGLTQMFAHLFHVFLVTDKDSQYHQRRQVAIIEGHKKWSILILELCSGKTRFRTKWPFLGVFASYYATQYVLCMTFIHKGAGGRGQGDPSIP